MKKIFSLILVSVMLLSFAACGGNGGDTSTSSSTVHSTEGTTAKPLIELAKIVESGVVKVGMECDYAPFNWTQAKSSDTAVAIEGGGYADGYDVQIAKKIAKGLGVELKIVKTDWDGLTTALTSGTIDLIIAGMSPLADRKVTIDFSDYYYASELVMVVKKDGPYKDATSITDFKGAKITGQLNTFHYDVIKQIEGVKKQTALADFPAMIVALNSGAIDGYVSEKPGADSAVAANSNFKFIEFKEGKGFTFVPDEVNVSVGTRKGSDLTAKINEVLSGISEAQRIELMNDAIKNQPISEEK
ncbi:MAG: transporter substrate-binding domain-containing protein [Clostridiales bacterium]|jgi:putative lysine transport system substrate-binding protein|nr:transporter substrate-binding domain-containing protein [Clostridiales bacterium]